MPRILVAPSIYQQIQLRGAFTLSGASILLEQSPGKAAGAMTTRDGIPGDERVIVEELFAIVGECSVILCGSRATEGNTDVSDYDIVVVLPGLAIPRKLGLLGAAADRLQARLGVAVSVNPVPPSMLSRPDNLFRWKLRREARVLAAPKGFRLPAARKIPLTDEGEFSYLLSAVFFLIEELVPSTLGEPRLPEPLRRGVEKALLHVGQLRLMRRGRYGSTLDQVVEQLGDPSLADIAASLSLPAGWLAVRAEVLHELGPRPARSPLSRALVRNLQYAGISHLRGRQRWRAVLTLRSVDRRLSLAAVRLLRAVQPTGAVDGQRVAAAQLALPPSLRRDCPPIWSDVRDLVAQEWASAHPLLGL